jgi:oxygen-independent coproporphyrinogen-3 oxidase
MLNFQSTIPLSLYIHLPWCIKKCPYCDFNSHEVGKDKIPEDEYIDALIKDIEYELPRIWGRSITSIFIGGGTPSLFSPAALERLLSAIRALLNTYPDIEITLEANPGTAEAERFKAYRKLGINRLSIGVQSFDDEKLKTLGRIHNSEEACNAITMAYDAGFEDLNIDLMFGLQDQSVADAINDLRIAVEHAPRHISWYQLTIEPNTVFYSRPPALSDDDHTWEMQQQGQQFLKENGFDQYEISAYASEKQQCVHNLNYWQFGDYLGIGAGAHSKITNVPENTVTRLARHRIPKSYLQTAGTDNAIVETRKLRRDDLVLEFMMNALRLIEGVHPSLFMERTGLPLRVVEECLKEAEEKGLLEWSIDHLRASESGQRYLNDLLQLFMSVEKPRRSAI